MSVIAGDRPAGGLEKRYAAAGKLWVDILLAKIRAWVDSEALRAALLRLWSLTRVENSMCLAVPMRIISLSGSAARCEARGVQREVSLFLLEDGSVAVGDYVLVHVGYAIQTISTQDADASWALFDQITASLDRQNA